MTDESLLERRVSSREVYRGGFLRVHQDTVRLPDGAHAQREYVVHPGAVVIVPVLPDGKLVFERQFRYPVGEVFLELPAGKLDPDETLLACAQRELLEEFRGSLKGDGTHSPKADSWFEGVKRFFGDL